MGSPAMLALAVRQLKKKSLTGVVFKVWWGVFCLAVCWEFGRGEGEWWGEHSVVWGTAAGWMVFRRGIISREGGGLAEVRETREVALYLSVIQWPAHGAERRAMLESSGFEAFKRCQKHRAASFIFPFSWQCCLNSWKKPLRSPCAEVTRALMAWKCLLLHITLLPSCTVSGKQCGGSSHSPCFQGWSFCLSCFLGPSKGAWVSHSMSCMCLSGNSGWIYACSWFEDHHFTFVRSAIPIGC